MSPLTPRSRLFSALGFALACLTLALAFASGAGAAGGAGDGDGPMRPGSVAAGAGGPQATPGHDAAAAAAEIAGAAPGRAALVASPALVVRRGEPLDATVERLAAHAPGLRRDVLRLALEARLAALARGLAKRTDVLTVIDYSLPSTERRLWVFDVRSGEMLFHELVAHGKNTGENFARRFSNREGSLETSLGLFRTVGTYAGRNGYSLALDGLEPGFNDRAADRAVVMHGAPYVSAAFAAVHGRLGRSWGCPALSQEVAARVIDTIKGGSLLFSYFPDSEWLSHSRFLPVPGATLIAGSR